MERESLRRRKVDPLVHQCSARKQATFQRHWRVLSFCQFRDEFTPLRAGCWVLRCQREAGSGRENGCQTSSFDASCEARHLRCFGQFAVPLMPSLRQPDPGRPIWLTAPSVPCYIEFDPSLVQPQAPLGRSSTVIPAGASSVTCRCDVITPQGVSVHALPVDGRASEYRSNSVPVPAA